MMVTRIHTTGSMLATATMFAVLAACCVLYTTDVAGQSIRTSSSTKAQVGIQVQVGQALALVGTNDLRFGRVAATNSGTVRRVARNSPDAGRFEVRGSGNSGIRVTYVAPTQLTNETGAGVIGVNLELYGASSQGNGSNAVRLLQNETVSLSGGRYYFFVGGDLTVGPLSRNPPGIYVGEFALEVSYLDL